MKQFTVKDFIAYNAPCFSCGNEISFRVEMREADGGGTISQDTLRPTMYKEYFSIDLQIRYKRSLQLWVFYQTNKIISSDMKELEYYLHDHHLSMKSYCDRCYTSIVSDELEFNLKDSFIKPVSLSHESIKVSTEDNMFMLETYYHNSPPLTNVWISSLTKPATSSPAKLELPVLPLYKFKTKERLINKLKTYLTFS